MNADTKPSPPTAPMSAVEYKDLKARSRITVIDIWCGAIRVSKDQDKSYSSNRTTIPEAVATRVRQLSVKIGGAASQLQEQLQHALPECAVVLHDTSLEINISFPNGKVAKLENRGLDLANLWPLYIGNSGSGREAVFVYTFPSHRDQENPKTAAWFLWRGDFLERLHGPIQNSKNTLTDALLLEALKR